MPKIFDKDPVLLDLPETIYTPRLVLKSPSKGDGKLISAAVKETWDILHQWEDWAVDREEHSSIDFWETRNRRALVKFILREALEFRCYSRETGKFIGIADICYPNWRVRSFVIGYWITSSEHNKGYATEASNALIRYCFDVLSAGHVGIGHAVGNGPSQRIIEKLGFQLLGTRPNILELSNNRIVDDKIYYLSNADNLPTLDLNWS